MLIRLLLLAALIWGIRRLFFGYGPAPENARLLTARETAVVAAAGDALFPRGGAIPPSGSQAGAAEWVDGYVASVPAMMRILMRLLFLLVEQATLLFPAPGSGGRRRFSALSLEQQQAVLEGWRTSSLFPRRLVFTSLRAILCMAYLADPRVLDRLELSPWEIESPVVEADLLYPRIGQPRSSITRTEADLTPPGEARPLGAETPIHPDYRVVTA